MTPVPTAPTALGTGPGASPRGRRRRDVRDSGWVGWVFVLPGFLGLALFIVVPVVASLALSLFDYSLLGGGEFTGLDNLLTLLRDPAFLQSLAVTTVFVVVYTPLNMALSLGMALWLNTRLGGKRWLRVIFLIPALSPTVANAVVFRLLLQQDGAVNSGLASIGLPAVPWLSDGSWALVAIILVSLWQSFGYNMIVLGAGIDGISQDVLAASRIDGAGTFRRFRSIVLPLLSPSLFFTTVLTVIGAWQVFIQAYIITGGGPGGSTSTIVMYLYRTGFTYDQLGYASTISAVLFVIIALVTLVQVWGQKKWVHYD